MRRRVVVTGIGMVNPMGHDVETVWKGLKEAKSGVDKITIFDASSFPTKIAAEVKNFDPAPAFPTPKELRRTDRFTHFGVHAGWQALKDSGLDLEKVNRDEIGVFIGSGIGGLHTTAEQHDVLREKGPGRLSPFMIPMLILNMASGMFSMYYRLRGPNVATCSACATATHAIGEAWRTIKMGDAAVMFAGGTEATITDIGIGGFCAMKAMSTRRATRVRFATQRNSEKNYQRTTPLHVPSCASDLSQRGTGAPPPAPAPAAGNLRGFADSLRVALPRRRTRVRPEARQPSHLGEGATAAAG